MEFHGFFRRNEKYLWIVFFFALFILLSSYKFERIYLFLKMNPTLGFLSVTAVIAYKSFFSQRHLAIAKNTIDFQTAFHNSDDVKKATKYFVSVISQLDTAEIEALALRERSQEKGARSARELLNSWERVAVAVRNKVYDEEMLYNTYSGFLIAVWQTLSPYVHKKRLSNPKFFVEVQWLAIRWRIRRDAKLTKFKEIQLQHKLNQIEDLLSET
ncbi:hypothetical protein A8L59_16695 [Pseudomonas koreensis]|uniref:DUF4760 domain-containing protein n=1 Tax=Pseudomonas koreensis TaxID=198620 RepID=A0AAC9BUH2_9PSED|nr:DUF4760 domain-containing protein [Pseudomonas koreensis]ANH98983.1 hypothetical protein A8L59_16695 [Pseudomonas koreensis]